MNMPNDFSDPQPPSGEPPIPVEEQEEEITGRDILRVIVLTLLVLFAGFVAVSYLAFLELVNKNGMPEVDSLSEWMEQGVTSLPNSIKLMMIVVQLALILPAWWYLRRKRFTVPVHLRLHPVPGVFLFYGLLIGPCLAVIGDELSRLVDMILPMPESQIQGIQALMRLHTVFDYLTLGLTVAILAPIVEEALFRGFFQRWFERQRGVTTGVLSASAIFAMYHFNIYWLIPILLMATILGAMAWRVESIWPSVVVHATNNTLGVIGANLSGDSDPSWYVIGGHVAPWWIAGAIVLMVWSLRRYFRLAEELKIGGHGPAGDRGANVNLSA